MKSFTRVALCLSAIVLAASTARAQEMFTLTLPRVREALVRGDAQYATGWTIDCGYWDGSTKCSAKYPAGTTVILSGQSIASGFVWDGWGGDCASSTGGRCVLVMNANRNVKANVKAVGNATIKVSPITHGMIAGKTPTVGNDDVIQCPTGAKRCSFSITTGSTMRLFPFPELGYKTGSWTGACAGQGYECNLTLTGTMEVGYTFEPAPVSFAVVAPPNSTIKFADKTCTGSCTYQATINSKIVLELVPSAGYIIQAWGGDCAGQRSPCTFTLSRERMSANGVVVKQ
jgi:hypothetical protein